MITFLVILNCAILLFAFALSFYISGLFRAMLLVFPHMTVKAAVWLWCPLLVRYFSSADGNSLRWPFGWAMTKDADLRGDSYWQIECAQKGLDPNSYEAKVAWLRKNGGHTANYEWFGVDVSQEWVDLYRDPKTGFITGGPLWISKDAFELWLPVLGWDIMFGWNLIGHQNGRAKYWIQFRRSKPLNP
ncbi:MAG TPA: hypothetical protein PKL28_07325 [Rhodocyclaceae bacterium]|nr:hypothetical protein [Rhodocyclaceae bacterium]